jgi:two-component system sensor histidine kinase AlgZ
MDEEHSSFLPDFCRVRAVLAVVLSSAVLAMVIALASVEVLSQLWSDFSLAALYVLWIALAAAGVACLLRGWLARMSRGRAGVTAWLLLLLVCALVAEATAHLLPVEIVAGISSRDLLVRTLGIGAILGALILRYLYEYHLQKQRELAEDQARYLALQARIRPHFLFNSLNTVISLVPAQPEKAQQILHDLSDLFRASLGGGEKRSTLVRELALTRQYIEVEKLRLGERLRVSWDLDDLPGLAAMPPLLLQPLVENAVYHGIEPSVEGGEIRIFGRCRKGKIVLSVSNSLPAADERQARGGNRMAMENIRQRLRVFFGEEAGMHTGLVEGQYQVRIWFPEQEQAI